VSLKTLSEDAPAQEVVGEHLRVFVAECTWQWAQEHGFSYEEATSARQKSEHATDFSRLFNASSFEAAMLARGVVLDTGVFQWESASKSGEWVPYEPEISKQIDVAHQRGIAEIRIRLGPKCWQYVIDFNRMVQRNPKTGVERALRNVAVASSDARTRPGQLTLEILQQSIKYFVDMQTLPPAPGTSYATPLAEVPKACESPEAIPCLGGAHASSEVLPDPPILPGSTSSEPAKQPLNVALEEAQQETQHETHPEDTTHSSMPTTTPLEEEPAPRQEAAGDECKETSPELKLVDVP